MKDAAHKTGDAVDKAGKDIKQGAQKAGDKIDRAATAAKEELKNNQIFFFTRYNGHFS